LLTARLSAAKQDRAAPRATLAAGGEGTAVMWWFVLVILVLALGAVGSLLLRTLLAPSIVGAEALRGRRALVREADGDAGWVVLDGARWAVRARGGYPLHPGQRVRVVGRCGLHLLVEAEVGAPRVAA
jgi:membrane protein implicated in regulation of membrane protease activity